jgi:hypothetical protein
MATVSSRAQFTDYCLRKLGFPVIEINVDPDQVSDRIDDALQYFQDYHFDGLQKTYYIHKITQEDVDNKYLDLTGVRDNANVATQVVGVTRIFPLQDSQSSVNMFDLRYQLRLNELYDFTSASYINYTMTMQHLRMLEQLFTGEVPIRYQRHTEKLFADWAWGDQEAPVGQPVIVDCYTIINPEVYNRVWDDRWLKRYATALIKRQWGSNLMKFGGIQLPGGVMLNGDKIFEEAMDEINELEKDMENNYGGVLEWFMN